MLKVIRLKDHPCNTCRSSKRMSPARELWGVYKCEHGFKPVWEAYAIFLTFEGYQKSYDDAAFLAEYGENTSVNLGSEITVSRDENRELVVDSR